MRLGDLPGCLLLLLIGLVPIGCAPDQIDTTPGRSRGISINGTGAFAELLRGRGHEVRAAVRATVKLADWADVIVRFSLHRGLPDRDEGRWLVDWLRAKPGRTLVYVAHDFDAEPEFWDAMLRAEPKDATPDRLERIKQKRDHSQSWVANLPAAPKEPARAAEWFAFEPNPGSPTVCKALGGPWAEGVDAVGAAVSRHETFHVEKDGEPILLSGDGSPLAISWTFDNGSRTLAIANASFLLNASMLNRARRPLTMQVASWIGEPGRHVAFVEGARPMPDDGDMGSASPFRLLRVWPFDWISAHLLGFLLLLALAYAVRLGRPLLEAPSGVERPSAHPEALGALLARTLQNDYARTQLEAYRRWRHPSTGSGRSAPSRRPPSS